jgi:hypothetical protein
MSAKLISCAARINLRLISSGMAIIKVNNKAPCANHLRPNKLGKFNLRTLLEFALDKSQTLFQRDRQFLDAMKRDLFFVAVKPSGMHDQSKK